MSHFQVNEQTTQELSMRFFSLQQQPILFFSGSCTVIKDTTQLCMVCGEGDRRRTEHECKHFFFFFNFAQEKYKVICQTSDFALSCSMTLKKRTHTYTFYHFKVL